MIDKHIFDLVNKPLWHGKIHQAVYYNGNILLCDNKGHPLIMMNEETYDALKNFKQSQ